MKIHIKFDNIEATITRPFNLRAEPAFSFKASNYEVSADLEQLASGFKELIEQLMKTEEPDSAFFKPVDLDDIMRKARADAGETHYKTKPSPDSDVPQ